MERLAAVRRVAEGALRFPAAEVAVVVAIAVVVDGEADSYGHA